jgi:hypothetical protein
MQSIANIALHVWCQQPVCFRSPATFTQRKRAYLTWTVATVQVRLVSVPVPCAQDSLHGESQTHTELLCGLSLSGAHRGARSGTLTRQTCTDRWAPQGSLCSRKQTISAIPCHRKFWHHSNPVQRTATLCRADKLHDIGVGITGMAGRSKCILGHCGGGATQSALFCTLLPAGHAVCRQHITMQVSKFTARP